jgi:hypothetical protein
MTALLLAFAVCLPVGYALGRRHRARLVAEAITRHPAGKARR